MKPVKGDGAGDGLDALLAEQLGYYRARAAEYDELYADRADWDALIAPLPIGGDMLELACGTGRWAPLLATRSTVLIPWLPPLGPLLRIGNQHTAPGPVMLLLATAQAAAIAAAAVVIRVRRRA